MSTLINVKLKNGRTCQIAPEALDLLLEHNEISKFKRSEGWAIVGRDPLRNKDKGIVYSIPERRSYLMDDSL